MPFNRCPKCGFRNYVQRRAEELTPDEEDTMTLLMQGYSPLRISRVLDELPVNTRMRLLRIYKKFGVQSALELVSETWKQGAIQLWQYDPIRGKR